MLPIFALKTFCKLYFLCTVHIIRAEVSNEQTGKTLVLGKATAKPDKQSKALQMMADYLVAHIHDLGYTKGKLLLSRSKKELARHLQQGKVDLVTETAFSAMYLQAEAGAAA